MWQRANVRDLSACFTGPVFVKVGPPHVPVIVHVRGRYRRGRALYYETNARNRCGTIVLLRHDAVELLADPHPNPPLIRLLSTSHV